MNKLQLTEAVAQKAGIPKNKAAEAVNAVLDAITDALVNGNFYASQGPIINALWIEDNILHIECEPAAEVRVTTGIRRTAQKKAKDGVGVTSMEYAIEPTDVYFRVTVTGFDGKHANTNAYFVE